MSTAPIDKLAALSLHPPYSCTYLCGETFTTPTPWRQHELRAHRQPEIWRCGHEAAAAAAAAAATAAGPPSNSNTNTCNVPPDVCGECFYRAADLATHLSSAHGIVGACEHEAWIAQGHIHAEGQVNFWCGFCRGIRKLEEKGVEAWLERLDHVQGHFEAGEVLEEGWLGLKD